MYSKCFSHNMGVWVQGASHGWGEECANSVDDKDNTWSGAMGATMTRIGALAL
jgi:hypothetical protein